MTTKYMQAFADNLKTLMEVKNLKTSDLAREVNINHQTLSRYLACQRVITLENLCKIADYFEEDIDVLLGRREY